MSLHLREGRIARGLYWCAELPAVLSLCVRQDESSVKSEHGGCVDRRPESASIIGLNFI